ncbi:mitochondrial transcription termination factor 5 [Brevipalpus obovatus]|uniref:mitochondrial transcription termination factor 5 n=1 Tax=Brevipalpus obovatus TaxID=246614 RepID=UPI003D9FA9CC
MISGLCKIRSYPCLRSAERKFFLKDHQQHVKNLIRSQTGTINSPSYRHDYHQYLVQRPEPYLYSFGGLQPWSSYDYDYDLQSSVELEDELSEDGEDNVNIQPDVDVNDGNSIISQEFKRTWQSSSVISKQLGISPEKGEQLFMLLHSSKKWRQKAKSPNYFSSEKTVVCLLRKYFSTDVILSAYQLLILTPKNLSHRIGFLEDCGFKKITPHHLINFPSIIKRTEKELKDLKFLQHDASIVDSLVESSCLENEEDREELKSLLTRETLSIKDSHSILISFLKTKFEYPVELPRMTPSKSLTISWNQVQKLNLPVRRNHSYLRRMMSADPENLFQIIKKVPEKFDQEIMRMIFNQPRLLHVNVDTILERLDFFKNQLNLSNEDIDAFPSCLTKDTSELTEKLEILKSQFPKLKIKPIEYLSLLMLPFNEFLQAIDRMVEFGADVFGDEMTPLTMSSVIQESLSSSVRRRLEGKKIGRKKNCEESPEPPCAKLADKLDLSMEELERTLCRYPSFDQLSFETIENTYHHLKQRGDISPEQLKFGICAVLYQPSVLDEAFAMIEKWENYDTWKKSPYFLEAIVYIIEKSQNFDGTSIFFSTLKPEDFLVDDISSSSSSCHC